MIISLKMTNIIIVSNGYGEDLIGSFLARSFKSILPEADINAFPLVGNGAFYQKAKVNIIANNKLLPSGGFIRNPIILVKDLFAGLFQQIVKNIILLNKNSRKADYLIVVGDVFALILASLFNKKTRYFIATAKSDLFMPHSFIERIIIKKLAKYVFTRDQITADSLKKHHIPALFLGNIMTDTVEFSSLNYNFQKQDEIIGLFPGSRLEAIGNLDKMLIICEIIQQKKTMVKFILAKADTLDLSKLNDQNWQIVKNQDFSYLRHKKKSIIVNISKEFGDVIKFSDVILGLAGTANEQAVYYGKKVISFVGTGAQSSKKRFLEQRKLLGENLLFLSASSSSELAEAILSIFQSLKKNENLPLKTNHATKIAEFILSTFSLPEKFI